MFLMVMDMADSPKDQRKIVKLYEKYNRLMYVIAYNIVQHHEDAEDVVLAAWAVSYTHLTLPTNSLV